MYWVGEDHDVLVVHRIRPDLHCLDGVEDLFLYYYEMVVRRVCYYYYHDAKKVVDNLHHIHLHHNHHIEELNDGVLMEDREMNYLCYLWVMSYAVVVAMDSHLLNHNHHLHHHRNRQYQMDHLLHHHLIHQLDYVVVLYYYLRRLLLSTFHYFWKIDFHLSVDVRLAALILTNEHIPNLILRLAQLIVVLFSLLKGF